MKKNIFITAEPGIGKSTLLAKLVSDVTNKCGFVTTEMREERGRVGFQVESFANQKAVIAHVDFDTDYKVSKYGVSVASLESIIPSISNITESALLYIDEIGQMQLFSEMFKRLVFSYLESRNTFVATLSCVHKHSVITHIHRRDDTIFVKLTPDNREQKYEFVSQLIQKIEKARRYITEPERLATQGKKLQFQSNHGIRELYTNEFNNWVCNCDFYSEHRICSHVIAVEEIGRMG